MRINHNISALNTYRQLSVNSGATGKSLEKLSSGYRINRAGDDAAGLAISEKMRSQIRGLDMAAKNANDGISLIQTAEGALQETHSILQRIRELAVQSANGTNSEADGTAAEVTAGTATVAYGTSDRDKLQNELFALTEEIKRISTDTEFNGMKLLDGSLDTGTEITFHIGANADQTVSLAVGDMGADALNISSAAVSTTAAPAAVSAGNINISTQANAEASLDAIDTAITSVSNQRSALGAMQNRLEHTINNLGTTSENLAASESRIRDVDMAKEMMEFTKNNILTQAATAMLAQANMQPQSVLQLLQ